jgi:hypothetical protein
MNANNNVGVVGDAMTQPATQGLPDLLMPPPPAGPDLGQTVVQDVPAVNVAVDERAEDNGEDDQPTQGKGG